MTGYRSRTSLLRLFVVISMPHVTMQTRTGADASASPQPRSGEEAQVLLVSDHARPDNRMLARPCLIDHNRGAAHEQHCHQQLPIQAPAQEEADGARH